MECEAARKGGRSSSGGGWARERARGGDAAWRWGGSGSGTDTVEITRRGPVALSKCTYAICFPSSSSHVPAVRGIGASIADRWATGRSANDEGHPPRRPLLGLSQTHEASALDKHSFVRVSVTTGGERKEGRCGASALPLVRARRSRSGGTRRLVVTRCSFYPRSHVGRTSRSAILDTPSDALRRRAIVTDLISLGQVRGGEHAAVTGVCVRVGRRSQLGRVVQRAGRDKETGGRSMNKVAVECMFACLR